MRTRKLGAVGPEISVIGYGAWEAGGDMWGAASADEAVRDAMRAALDAGSNWIDTAEAYGEGRSEELVAGILAERPRDEVLVFTKVAPFVSGTRPEEIGKAIRGSLERLGVEDVDLYQVHWPDEERVPVEETWGAMAGLVDEGLARYIGVSNFDRSLVERCEAVRHVDSVQNQFSLLHQQDRAELLPWLADRGIGYLAYGPLGFGLLTGAITTETTFDDSDWRSGKTWDLGYYHELFAPEPRRRALGRVERLRAIAGRLDVSLATLALAAAIAVDGVTAAIAGSTKANHVRANAEAAELALDDATLAEIASIFEAA